MSPRTNFYRQTHYFDIPIISTSVGSISTKLGVSKEDLAQERKIRGERGCKWVAKYFHIQRNERAYYRGLVPTSNVGCSVVTLPPIIWNSGTKFEHEALKKFAAGVIFDNYSYTFAFSA